VIKTTVKLKDEARGNKITNIVIYKERENGTNFYEIRDFLWRSWQSQRFSMHETMG
jgi:hypothetical protein